MSEYVLSRIAFYFLLSDLNCLFSMKQNHVMRFHFSVESFKPHISCIFIQFFHKMKAVFQSFQQSTFCNLHVHQLNGVKSKTRTSHKILARPQFEEHESTKNFGITVICINVVCCPELWFYFSLCLLVKKKKNNFK